jgi:hypothetical protein
MRILVLNGGTGTVKAALATTQGKRVVVERRETVETSAEADEESLIAAEVAQLLGGTV